jgi:hypothetical protein
MYESKWHDGKFLIFCFFWGLEKIYWLKHFCIKLAVVFLGGALCLSFAPVSPMAKLMREMLTFLKKEKKAIENREVKNHFPTHRHHIYNAALTPGKQFSPQHKDLSDDLLNKVQAYENASSLAERKEKFNLIIQSCVACHVKVCPGPVETIQLQAVE